MGGQIKELPARTDSTGGGKPLVQHHGAPRHGLVGQSSL